MASRAEEGRLLDSVVQEELELLERVSEALKALPASRHASEGPIQHEIERIRDVIVSGEEGKDISSLTEQLHHQSALLKQLRAARTNDEVDPRSPYFGHLRLREGDREWDLCLGRVSCLDKGVRILDWRDAPIARLFYSYRQGEDYDEEIAGRERIGRVVTRRMLRIQAGELDRIQAPEADFVRDKDRGDWRRDLASGARLSGGEASAIRVHGAGLGGGAVRRLGTDAQGRGHPADKRLPEITGLIDPDQYDLITQPSSGFLVIRGAAGSGKTTVALHRVAYLAYADPRIDGPETLVAVFSPALEKYVGHVLPSLGLRNIGIVTFRDWLAEQRRRHYPALPDSARTDSPALVQTIKLHPMLGLALERQVEREAEPRGWEQALDDWASVLTIERVLRDARDRAAPGVFSDDDLRRFVDWNRKRVEEVYAVLGGDRNTRAELDAEDDALLLRAWQLRVGPLRSKGRRPLEYRHVVLDEVQDFSPLEVRLLLDCLTKDASITLAGDTQQHLSQHGGFTSWQEFLSNLGIAGRELKTLKINYRSSVEIARFGYSLLGELGEETDAPEATRTGPPVEVFRFDDRGSCVFFLAEALRALAESEPLASVAVLTPSRELSGMYFEGLERADLPRLRRIEEQDFSFAAGIEVTEVEQVKGLEFDYVILVDADARHFPDDEAARRRLHVGATRAIHQLWLTSVGTPSPLLAGLLAHAASA